MSLALQSVLSKFTRLRVSQAIVYNGFHSSSVLGIKSSDACNMKSTDMKCASSSQIDNARLEKMKKKIIKEIRRLERRGQRILKPVEENMIWPAFKKDINMGIRTRTDKQEFSSEELENNILLQKEWGRYRQAQSEKEWKVMRRVKRCQENAMKALRAESEELYFKALELDESTFEFKSKGPCETPPIPNYDAPDGNYFDKTEYFVEEKMYEPDAKIKQAFFQAEKKQRDIARAAKA